MINMHVDPIYRYHDNAADDAVITQSSWSVLPKLLAYLSRTIPHGNWAIKLADDAAIGSIHIM
jgi:hypothetical protein